VNDYSGRNWTPAHRRWIDSVGEWDAGQRFLFSNDLDDDRTAAGWFPAPDETADGPMTFTVAASEVWLMIVGAGGLTSAVATALRMPTRAVVNHRGTDEWLTLRLRWLNR